MKLEKKINYIVMNVNLADIHMCNHRKIIIAICRLLVSNRNYFLKHQYSRVWSAIMIAVCRGLPLELW